MGFKEKGGKIKEREKMRKVGRGKARARRKKWRE